MEEDRHTTISIGERPILGRLNGQFGASQGGRCWSACALCSCTKIFESLRRFYHCQRFCNEYVICSCAKAVRSLGTLFRCNRMKTGWLRSYLPPRVQPHRVRSLQTVPRLPHSDTPIWCQVCVDFGLVRHDLEPWMPTKNYDLRP